MRWNRSISKGYGAKVLYEDGYIEIEPVATLVTLHQRKELSDVQKLWERVESTTESQCQGMKINGGMKADIRATAQEENGRLEEHEERYLGQKVLKWFLNAHGVWEWFTGVVTEVWDNDGNFMAHIVYEEDDLEDISVEELEQLLQQGEAPPGFDKSGVKLSHELQ